MVLKQLFDFGVEGSHRPRRHRAQPLHLPLKRHHGVGIAEHRRIVAALGSADPVRARQAMDEHMQQTLADLKTYVLGDLSPADR